MEIYYNNKFYIGKIEKKVVSAAEYYNNKKRKGDITTTFFLEDGNGDGNDDLLAKIDFTNINMERVTEMSVSRRLELGYYRNNKTEPTYQVKQKIISDIVDNFIIDNIPNNSSVDDLKTFLNGIIKDREQVSELTFTNIKNDYIQENINILTKFKKDLETEFKTDSNTKKDTLWYKILNMIDDDCEIDISDFHKIYEEYSNLSELLV